MLSSEAQEAGQAQEQQQRFSKSRIEMIRGYAEVRDYRREYLLNYFGEGLPQPCGFCDRCEAGVLAEDADDAPFPLNSRMSHQSWGEGLVLRYEGSKLLVLFDEVSYKTLGLDLVLERGLLTRVG